MRLSVRYSYLLECYAFLRLVLLDITSGGFRPARLLGAFAAITFGFLTSEFAAPNAAARFFGALATCFIRTTTSGIILGDDRFDRFRRRRLLRVLKSLESSEM